MDAQKPAAEPEAAVSQKKTPTAVKDIGVSSDRNARHRRFMEDAHIVEDGFGGVSDRAFFCIFDGHGGKSAALFAEKNMRQIFQAELDALGERLASVTADQMRALFTDTFKKLDDAMKPEVPAAGACVVCAFLQKQADGQRWLFVANAGDSRAILKRGDTVVNLTEEHKPTNAAEAERVKALGAFLKDDGTTVRVNGMIGVTRALGDHMMKDLLISTPYCYATPLTAQDQAIILACDGVWDEVKDSEAFELVKSEPDATAMSRRLMIEALKRGSTDNLSVIVVLL